MVQTDKKRILFVSSMPLQYNFSANIRNTALIDGLIRNGHTVDVLTCEPNRESEWFDNTIDISAVNQYIYRGIDIANSKKRGQQEIKGSSGRLKTTIKKIAIFFMNMSVWDVRIIQVRRIRDFKLKDKYDLMISSSDPKSSHYLAKRLYYRNKDRIGQWIQYWGDPFSIDINITRSSKRRVKKAEEGLLALADKVIYVSPFTLNCQKEIFKKYSDKMYFLPIPVKQKNEIQGTVPGKCLRIGYYGAYFKKDRDIRPLYEAVKMTEHYLEVYGPSDIKLNNASNITVHEKVPLSIIEEREKEVDVLVCVCNRSGTQIPGKAYHYAMTGKYVLVLLDGEYAEDMEKYFEEYGRYLLCKNNTNSIIEMLKAIPEDCKYTTPCKNFDTRKIANEFIL